MPLRTNDCVGTGWRATRASHTPYVALNPTAMIASKTCTNLTTTKSDIAARVYACGTRSRGGWRRERVEQRRGLLSERPLDGGPSRSHRGRAKRTPALLAPSRIPTTRRYSVETV